MNPTLILTILAIILAALSYVWPQTLGASVVVLAAAIIISIAK